MDRGRWSVLGVAGVASLCCLGIGALAGGAAVAGGTAGVTAVSTSAAGLAGALVTAGVTAAAVLAVGLVLRWRAGG